MSNSSTELTFSESEDDVFHVYDQNGNVVEEAASKKIKITTSASCSSSQCTEASSKKRGPRGNS